VAPQKLVNILLSALQSVAQAFPPVGVSMSSSGKSIPAFHSARMPTSCSRIRIDPLGKPTLQLLIRRAQAQLAPVPCYEVHHRLGLHQVDPSIHEGPLRELPGSAWRAPRFVQQADRAPERRQGLRASVDLHNVLTSVRCRSAHEPKGALHRPVLLRPPGSTTAAIVDPMALRCADIPALLRPEETCRDINGIPPAHADDADAPFRPDSASRLAQIGILFRLWV